MKDHQVLTDPPPWLDNVHVHLMVVEVNDLWLWAASGGELEMMARHSEMIQHWDDLPSLNIDVYLR